MQTGIISFCGKQGLNIKSNDAKRILNEKLEGYGINILKRHFDRFSPESDKKISSIKHFISLKSNGNPYLLFLTRFNGVDTAMFVDKKIQHGYFLPRMIIDRLSFKSSLFEDTVIDGEMVKIKDEKWLFIMNDLFVYRSKKMGKYNLLDRLGKLHLILQTKYFPIPNQKYVIQVKRYFHDLGDAMDFKETLDYTSRGIQYKQMNGKFKYILKNFDDSLITDVKRVKYSATNKFLEGTDTILKEDTATYDINQKVSLSSIKSAETSDSLMKKFYLQKTDQPDVYKLFDGESETGIASVSTMKTSKMLKNAFSDVNLNGKKVFNCEFSDKFNKWVPISLTT